MSARRLLEELRGQGAEFKVDGEHLRYRPKGVVTAELLVQLEERKGSVIKLLERERHKLNEAHRRSLIIKWARESGWIALHDPLTDQWHKVKASQCLPGAVKAANTHLNKKSSVSNDEGG